MRRLTSEEQTKRGCRFCKDMGREYKMIGKCKVLCACCPYGECPYHELDDYDTYRAHLKANPIEKLFST